MFFLIVKLDYTLPKKVVEYADCTSAEKTRPPVSRGGRPVILEDGIHGAEESVNSNGRGHGTFNSLFWPVLG